MGSFQKVVFGKSEAGGNMNSREEIVRFLIRAKRSTYAGKGAETVATRPKSHDLVFSEEDMMYYDTYIGGAKFAGEEGLWISGIPYWSMNYAGRVIGEHFSGDFLKAALWNVPEDKPFRGPEYYSDGDYSYKCTVNGGFEWFQGYETISYKEQIIYECHFHGGIIE